MVNNLERTASFWGAEAGTWEIGRGLHWTENIAIQERINKKASGDPRRNPYRFFIDFLARKGINLPLSSCLTLGCGAGDLERGLFKHNFSVRHDAVDVAEDAIKRAQEKAVEEKMMHISYRTADINHISLPSNAYDVVFGVAAVHHFVELEHIFSEVRKALKPGGFFFLNEFVGPTKFQWTDKQLSIVNCLLQILPEEYRKVRRREGIDLKKENIRPSIAEMDAIDPSEAVRSEDILKILPDYFEIIEKKELGGAMLHLLLQDIAGNFDNKKDKDRKLLEMLFEIEDTFVAIGELQSDFAVVIAQKK